MTSSVRDVPDGDLAVEQVTLLVHKVSELTERLDEVVDIMGRYAAAGGRDWATWNRLLDGLGRAGMNLMQYTGDPAHPDWYASARLAITDAAGATVRDSLVPEMMQRKIAEDLLNTIWQAGAHFLVSPHDWPDLLGALVLGAVRNAPDINNNDLMCERRES